MFLLAWLTRLGWPGYGQKDRSWRQFSFQFQFQVKTGNHGASYFSECWTEYGDGFAMETVIFGQC